MRRQGISPVWWFRSLHRRITGRLTTLDARLIHRERDLAVAWLPGSSPILVLVFISIQRAALHPDTLEFRAIASDHGRHHVLFINDRERSWYSKPDKRERVEAVVRRFIEAHGIETVWSMGNSMGGYSAILFCDRLPISRVVAFVPQILMTPAVIDHWSSHLTKIQGDVERDLMPIMANARCEFRLVTNDSYSDDLIHFSHLRAHLSGAPHIRFVIVPGQGHHVAAWLKKQGQLAPLVAALWTDDREGLENCSRALERPLDLSLA